MTIDGWQQRFERWVAQHSTGGDAAHDLSHFRRVWSTAKRIAAEEPVCMLVLLTACYFHDIISLPKNHPDSARASRLSAARAQAILREDFPDFPTHYFPALAHAIEAHSYSARIPPLTLEAKILQDADRLEALGAIGLARVFAVSGAMNAALFDADDPFAERRALDDKRWALDHFQTKLLRLPETMQTAKGRAIALRNAGYLVEFMAKLSGELRGDPVELDTAVLRRFAPSE